MSVLLLQGRHFFIKFGRIYRQYSAHCDTSYKQKAKGGKTMKPRRICAVFLCFSLFFITACSKNSAPKTPLCRVVTQVDIQGQEKDVQIRRHYTDNEKIQWVLIYLRTLNLSVKPQSPAENHTGSNYEISLKFSDGNQKIFHQTAHRYYRQQSRPWHGIDPAQAAGLYKLLSALPSDPDAVVF